MLYPLSYRRVAVIVTPTDSACPTNPGEANRSFIFKLSYVVDLRRWLASALRPANPDSPVIPSE